MIIDSFYFCIKHLFTTQKMNKKYKLFKKSQ